MAWNVSGLSLTVAYKSKDVNENEPCLANVGLDLEGKEECWALRASKKIRVSN